MPQDTSKTMKGLKDHKKAQKAKQVTKRMAAAEKSKAQKAGAVVIAKEITPCKQATSVPEEMPAKDTHTSEKDPSINEKSLINSDTAKNDLISTDLAVGNIENHPATCASNNTAKTHSTETPSSPVFDIHAHRKALEAALYENMETPKQMLARLALVVVPDAEFHQDVGDDETIICMDELDFDDFLASPKCRDDNGFETITVRNNSSDVVPPARSPPVTQPSAGAMVASSKAQDVAPTKIRSPTIEELFAMVASTGAKKVGSSKATNSRTLESVEAELAAEKATVPNALEHFHQGRAISMDQLFAAASSTDTKILRHPSAITQEPSTARNISLNPQADLFLPFVDRAIISMKVKEPKLATHDPKTVPAHDAASRPSNHALDAGSEKLKALLGIDSSSSSTSGSAHSRVSSPHEDGFTTPVTHYSVSPPPFGSYGFDPSCGPYPMWYPGFDTYHGLCAGSEYYGPGSSPMFEQQYAHFQQGNWFDMYAQPYQGYGW